MPAGLVSDGTAEPPAVPEAGQAPQVDPEGPAPWPRSTPTRRCRTSPSTPRAAWW
ncbi:hypothetical protein ACFQXA_10530 [Nocardiopsis composta]